MTSEYQKLDEILENTVWRLTGHEATSPEDRHADRPDPNRPTARPSAS